MIPNFIVAQVTCAFRESMLAVEIQVRTIYWGTTNCFLFEFSLNVGSSYFGVLDEYAACLVN